MPELPEVAALASGLENEAKGKGLLQVLTKEAGGGPRNGLYDDLVFSGTEEQEVHRVMEGRVLTGWVGRESICGWSSPCPHPLLLLLLLLRAVGKRNQVEEEAKAQPVLQAPPLLLLKTTSASSSSTWA